MWNVSVRMTPESGRLKYSAQLHCSYTLSSLWDSENGGNTIKSSLSHMEQWSPVATNPYFISKDIRK